MKVRPPSRRDRNPHVGTSLYSPATPRATTASVWGSLSDSRIAAIVRHLSGDSDGPFVRNPFNSIRFRPWGLNAFERPSQMVAVPCRRPAAQNTTHCAIPSRVVHPTVYKRVSVIALCATTAPRHLFPPSSFYIFAPVLCANKSDGRQSDVRCFDQRRRQGCPGTSRRHAARWNNTPRIQRELPSPLSRPWTKNN